MQPVHKFPNVDGMLPRQPARDDRSRELCRIFGHQPGGSVNTTWERVMGPRRYHHGDHREYVYSITGARSIRETEIWWKVTGERDNTLRARNESTDGEIRYTYWRATAGRGLFC